MLVSNDDVLVQQARKLATQARDAAPHYEHTEVGYNYRMSNLLAGVGRGQLAVLDDRVAARRANFQFYVEALGDLPGLSFQPEAGWGRHTRWLTCLLVDPKQFGATREEIRVHLEGQNIESRPLWKPMHLQPLYQEAAMYGGAVADRLFEYGLCLPSGSSLTPEDRDRIAGLVRSIAKPA
jgi:pyridoxal phosphate-dependent aminotransferase EpsN